ncbi:MAG TPA: hypothetical protein V6D47_19270 [Oscillatoriaceae cyanobacterium]
MRPVALLAVVGLLGCSARPGLSGYADARFGLQAVPAPPQTSVPVRTESHPSASATPPPATSSSGGAGGGGSVAGAPVTGQVIGLGGDGAQPLAGALVRTSDGRVATTDAGGNFSFAGPLPRDGQLVASANGYAASAIAGLPGTGEFALHLRAQTTSADTSLTAANYPILLKGTLVDGDGNPAAGVTVTLGDSHGSAGAPTTTNDAGQFSLSVYTPDRRVVNGTLIALGDGDYPWMGVATGIQADLAHEIIDFDPGTPAIDPMRLVPAAHRLTLHVTGTGALPPLSHVDLVGQDGTAMAVGFATDGALVADIPGAHYALDASAVDGMNGVSSRVHVEPLPIDFSTPDTEASATLLPPPVATATAVIPGSPVAWSAVPGATGYQVTLSSDAGMVWEAFTTATGLALSEPSLVGNAPYGLTVIAWDDATLAPRAVMGLQRLQVLPLSQSYRESQTLLRFAR